MPKDRYIKQHEKNARVRLEEKNQHCKVKPLRKCPSCNQDSVVEVHVMETKTIVQCKKCFLRYEFTKFPAFEEIDYYEKMIDVFQPGNDNISLQNINTQIPFNTEKMGESHSAADPKKQKKYNCPMCNLGNLTISPHFIHGSQKIKCSNEKCKSTFKVQFPGHFKLSTKLCAGCGFPFLIWQTAATEPDY